MKYMYNVHCTYLSMLGFVLNTQNCSKIYEFSVTPESSHFWATSTYIFQPLYTPPFPKIKYIYIR